LREPERVLSDVVEGKVSIRHAREAYGVVIDPDTISLDEAGTRVVRAGVGVGAGAPGAHAP
jgi:N-methylhydantoinase B